MFDTLSSKLNGVFEGLRKRGRLSEIDIAEALREVRLALLEADVALPGGEGLHRQGPRSRPPKSRYWTASPPASRSSRW